jgi:hypothetical protein
MSYSAPNSMSVKLAKRLFVGRFVVIACAVVFLPLAACAQSPGRQFLQGHVQPAVSRLHLQPVSRLSSEKRLNLAIGLPLRNQQALDDLLQQIYDPASPSYRHYLTPEQFTEQFGPTEEDYQAVIAFMESKGLTVTYRHPNRVVLDVSGSVPDIEKAFHVAMQVYQHPREARTFYAPDVEPSLDLTVPILHISGLDNFIVPRPMSLKATPLNKLTRTTPASGSGPSGSYMGNDFRAAYVPGVALDGSGQTVGLLELDGYYTSDITAYENRAGLPNITLTNVLVDSFSGSAGSNNVEVALDIEMAVAMATNLSKVIVYEEQNGGNIVDMLNRMATDNLAKQISSSWLLGDDPNYDSVYVQFMAHGQSFFQASGDDGAYYSGISQWADDTNITLVGGTTLSMTGHGGSWSSETAWNWYITVPPYTNSTGGGINFNNIPIPSWQQGINMTTNKGSTTLRNVPDVALTADNIFIVADNGQQEFVGGTSAAAPLWAALTALMNQQAVLMGSPTVGFLNPAIYAIGKGTNYTMNFHDITTGNNTNTTVANEYFAVPGYDLCTGWGTPIGKNLINTFVPPDTLGIVPPSGFIASGPAGGPFSPTSRNFFLINSGASSLTWSLINTSLWLNASANSGTLVAGATNSVTVSLTAGASSLAAGTYTTTVKLTNWNTHIVQNLQFALQVLQPLVVTPPTGFTASGPVGGPFNVTAQIYSVTNIGTTTFNWSLINTSLWINASPTGGTLAANESTPVTVGLNSTANNLAVGIYTTSLWFSNLTSHAAQNLLFTLSVGQSLVQNGGFEAGDFTDWTLDATAGINFVDDSSGSGISPHSGSYLAALGEYGQLGYLSQTLSTVSNQSYLFSLWLNSPNVSQVSGGQFLYNTPNEFSVSWNGSTLFDRVNIGQIGWTNLQFIVTATSSNTLLQFGERVDPWYFGLDDVNVWPIPNPSFRSMAKTSGNAVSFSWNTFTNMAYQVQYSTNLTKTNWIILSTNTATGPILTLTNSYGTDPQRFYRIRWLH